MGIVNVQDTRDANNKFLVVSVLFDELRVCASCVFLHHSHTVFCEFRDLAERVTAYILMSRSVLAAVLPPFFLFEYSPFLSFLFYRRTRVIYCHVEGTQGSPAPALRCVHRLSQPFEFRLFHAGHL